MLVWIHGGGLTEDAGRNYDPTKLAVDGVVAVTINYRLGALGFLAHPALASRPGGPRQLRADGPAGGAALGQHNIRAVRRRPQQRHHRGRVRRWPVGPGPPGLRWLPRAVPTGDHRKRIVRLNQQPLATAEAAGEAFAAQAGCRTRPPKCLRNLRVTTLVNPNFVEIPGVVDGKVLSAADRDGAGRGHFAHVPILNGTNHDEERLFVSLGLTVSRGTDVLIPAER